MNDSKLPFVVNFSKLKDNPKWFLKLLLLIFLSIIIATISSQMIDFTEQFKDLGMSSEQLESTQKVVTIGTYLSTIIGMILGAIFLFIIILVISKIMRSEVKPSSIFSAALLFTLINSVITIIVLLIQWATKLNPEDYTITSLNIFDKGNKLLAVFDIQVIIKTYLFGIILYATCLFSKKNTIIWSIIYLILALLFGIIGYFINS